MIRKLNKWTPIKGDDDPYYTLALRDCPAGFHFRNLVQDETLTHTNAIWDILTDYAERYYADYEVVGNTLKDFLNGLQLSYDGNKMMFENVLANLPYVRFDSGQTVTRTKNVEDSESGTLTKSRSYSEENEVTNEGADTRIVLGFNSTNEDPSDKTTSDSTQNTEGSGSEDSTDETERERSSEESESVVTDRFAGENAIDYYEKVLKVYPNIYELFVKMFETNFTMMEVLVW